MTQNPGSMLGKIRAFLPPLNFITVHYTYFIATCLVTSLVFWGSSSSTGGEKEKVQYTDALFLVVSAMTEAGLNTVNLSTLSTFQQVLLWCLIVIGSSVFVSINTVLTRKRAFEARFKSLLRRQKEGRRERRRSLSLVRSGEEVGKRLDQERKAVEPADMHEFESRHSGPRDPTSRPLGEDLAVDVEQQLDHEGRGRGRVSFVVADRPPHSSAYAPPSAPGVVHRAPTKEERGSEEEIDQSQYPDYLSHHTIGRNAQFYGLSRAEREHLGGVEYRAITLLAYVVPIYFVLWQLLGCLGLAAYMAYNKADVALENGINPWWLGIFNGVSAFNNSGMSLLDANMIPFQSSVYPLLTMGIMILAGNTAYPLFLRLILWTMLKLLTLIYPSPETHSEHKATLRFVLQYPRRVYTNLFPSHQTWWLLAMVILLNGIDWAAFELLNIGNAAVSAIPPHFRVLDGLFQAVAVRSGGFYIISIPSLRIGLQVLYVIMMYISVYPVVIAMRHSNVYEERSLGIYTDDPTHFATPIHESLLSRFKHTISNINTPFPSPPSTAGTQFIRFQLRSQLSHDLWWLVLAILFISCIEVSNFERDPVTYSVFNIAFEVVSGYGCVGISTGLPDQAYSFSGGWHKASKLILCAVMLRGRHRGLPVALDRAVRLPGAEGDEMDEMGGRVEKKEDGSGNGSAEKRRGSV